MKENTKGACAIFFTYVLWGVLPIYWKALASLDSTEIIAHRALWSCVFSFLMIFLARKGADFFSIFRSDRHAVVMLALSGAAVTANWYIYIWAVNSGKILESSLGYFINPLVSILFGLVFFKERLRKIQWLAVGIAATGVCAEVVSLGRLPFVSLSLAFLFGAYGLLKKMTTVDSLVGLTIETMFIIPFALSWLIYLQQAGAAHFPYLAEITLLLVGTGVVTAIPLIMFAWGVKKSTMTTVGLMQYTSPILMFLTATLIYHEPMPPARWASFSLTWLSIILFTAESILHAKKTRPDL